jgi:hypothetical protein
MATLAELTKNPELILRITEKKDFGRQTTNVDEGKIPKLSDRFETQKKAVREQIQIAEFKFPINFEGRTFYYQQYSKTVNARQSTVSGIAGVSSEAYGVGVQDIVMTGIFPPSAERNVIAATDLTLESALTRYTPKDWVDNLERFIKLYLDLNDPYSQIWTTKGYYQATSINVEGLVSLLIGGKGEDRKADIGYEGTPNKAGYELIVVDEYAKTIQSIQPKNDGLQTFATKDTPFTYGWRLNASIIEDKLDANFKEIPDDILQLAASFRLPPLSEIPVVGPASQTLNKLIAISNSINQMMNTILSYKNYPNTVVQDLNTLLYSNNQVLHKIERIAEL